MGLGTAGEGPSSGRCPLGVQRGPGRHSDTAITRWTKEVNKVGVIGLDHLVTEKFEKWLKKSQVDANIGVVQKSTLHLVS